MDAQKDTAVSCEEGLDELLDNCLEDFDQPLPKVNPPTNNEQSPSSSTYNETKSSDDTDEGCAIYDWSEEIKQFKDTMEKMLENESDRDEFQNLMDHFSGNNSGNLPENNPLNDYECDQTLADTLKELTQGAQNIPEMSPEELAGIFSNIGISDSSQASADELPELMPLMQDIMQKLMSKELLYPSLKEICDKYPNWLLENQSSLDPQEYNRYFMQFNVIQKICDEFEKEETDSEEEKKERFQKILKNMQSMQKFGNPPKELVSDVGQSIPLDEHGNLSLPGMPEQCSIM